MGKTDFTKVEDILIKGLQRMTIERLHELSAVSADVGAPKKNRAHQVAFLRQAIKWMHKLDPDLLKHLKIHRGKAHDLLSRHEELSEEEWKILDDYMERIEEFNKDLESELPDDYDETLIEQEREKHINKRFNVNESWLPLH